MAAKSEPFSRAESSRKLKSLLRDENILTDSSLRKYIDSHYGNKLNTPFSIYRRDNIGLDDEQRIYGTKVNFSRIIFDVPEIRIRNTYEISFNDCIFLGEVSIGCNIEEVRKIYIDSCVFKGALMIFGIDKSKSITIESVNCPNLRISGTTTNDLNISNCSIGILTVENSIVTKFHTFFNHIKYLQIACNSLSEVVFASSQLKILKLPSSHRTRLISKIESKFKFLEFTPSLDFDELSSQNNRVARNDTFKFLLEHSDVKLDRDAYAHVRYLETITSERTLLSSLMYRVSGALLKPSRIVIMMAVVMSIFTWIYSLPFLQFIAPAVVGSTKRTLTLPEAAYYSGVTFTTIGYGDIVPLDLARWLAITEGLLGMLLVSAFLVSLTRKYTE